MADPSGTVRPHTVDDVCQAKVGMRACMIPTSSDERNMQEGTKGIRPLESRTHSAKQYYGAVDIEDSLSPDGGPGPGDEATPAPAEEEEERTEQDPIAAEVEDDPGKEGPNVIRVPREPTQKERERERERERRMKPCTFHTLNGANSVCEAEPATGIIVIGMPVLAQPSRATLRPEQLGRSNDRPRIPRLVWTTSSWVVGAAII